VADINKDVIEAAGAAGGPPALKAFSLVWEAFKYNPIKLGFMALMFLFGWQIVDGQKAIERMGERHEAAADKAHAIFAKSLDKLDSSLNRVSDRLDENTRAIMSRGK
jgi:hypothetical protein